LLKKAVASTISVFRNELGQAIAEYAAMLGLLLAMLAIMRGIGRDANFVFRVVASMIN
jgi:hypothetical protein